MAHHRRQAGLLATGMVFAAGFIAANYAADRMQKHRRLRHRDDSAPALARRGGGRPRRRDVGRTVTIHRPRTELYAFWREFVNLPQVLEHVEDIEVDGEGRTVWTISGPAGRPVRLVTEIVEDRPGELIAWRSTPESDVETQGRISFADAPGDRGTLVTARISYEPPFGAVGRAVASLTQKEPAIQARRDLKRFKMLMETGEIARADMAPETDVYKEN